MSTELIKYAFISGELSPTLFGRTDLTKYDLAMALAYNWFVDYRGGLTTRPATEFLDFIKAHDKDIKLVEFQFSPDLSNTYVLMFGGLLPPVRAGRRVCAGRWAERWQHCSVRRSHVR